MAHGGMHCAHCGVSIQDQSSMVQRGDKQYCCKNCMMAESSGGGSMQGGMSSGTTGSQGMSGSGGTRTT